MYLEEPGADHRTIAPGPGLAMLLLLLLRCCSAAAAAGAREFASSRLSHPMAATCLSGAQFARPPASHTEMTTTAMASTAHAAIDAPLPLHRQRRQTPTRRRRRPKRPSRDDENDRPIEGGGSYGHGHGRCCATCASSASASAPASAGTRDDDRRPTASSPSRRRRPSRRPSLRLSPAPPPSSPPPLPPLPLLPLLLQLQLQLLLVVLLLTLQPTPTTATLYLHTASSDGDAIETPYPSEPARFGRVFDGTVTGPGNLFLPPRGVDGRLCSIDVDVEGDGNGGGGDSEDGDGDRASEDGEGARRRRRLDWTAAAFEPTADRWRGNGDYHPHRHRHRPQHHHHGRRLLDQTPTNDGGGAPTAPAGTAGGMEMDDREDRLPVLLEMEAGAEMEEMEGKEGAAMANWGDDDGDGDDDDDEENDNEAEEEEEEEEDAGEEQFPESTHRLRHRYLLMDDVDKDNRNPPRQRRDLHEQYDDAIDSHGGTTGNGHPHSYYSSSSSFPTSRSSSSAAGRDQPRPIALLVERGGCTFHEKAVNAMRFNRRLVREAVLLSRDGYGRTDGVDADIGADIGDDEDEDDGANRKRVYEFPDKGGADMGDDGNDAADGNGDGRRLGTRRVAPSPRTLQPDADATDTYDQDAIIEEGLDSVQRDMDKSEVGTAHPSDLLGNGGSPSSGYGNNGGSGNGNNNNIFVELPTLRIDYLVVYNDEVNSAYGKEDDLVLMDRPSNTQEVDRVDVGLVFISRRSGLDLRRRMDELSSTEYGTTVPWPSGLTTDYDKHGSDGGGKDDIPAYYLTARDMFPSTATENGGWFLPISVDQKKELAPYGTAGWTRGSTTRDSFYWIRFVLIALLIVTPVMRGCFVWHGAGGRVQFRRNDTGRIVGLHIVQPTGSWITGWDDGGWEEGDAERRRDRIRKMTQDEVFGLPEIEYTASTDEDTGERNGEDDGDDLESGEAANSKREDLDDINISSSDFHSTELEATASGNESTISSENSPATKTTCTSCSICIDDFEPGEKIRLLPRCGHAFHTDCILPWLTERSGSCPLCKRNVMGDGTDGLEESSADEHDSNSIIDGGDDAEERAIENEDEDVEEGRANSTRRPQDSRATRASISSSNSSGAIQTSNSARTRRARRRRRNGLDSGA